MKQKPYNHSGSAFVVSKKLEMFLATTASQVKQIQYKWASTHSLWKRWISSMFVNKSDTTDFKGLGALELADWIGCL